MKPLNDSSNNGGEHVNDNIAEIEDSYDGVDADNERSWIRCSEREFICLNR